MDRLAAAEAEVVVLVALRIHHPAPVPERRAPAAPVLVRTVAVEDEPAPFHFRDAQRPAAAAGHLALVQGEVHVLGGVAVLVEHA